MFALLLFRPSPSLPSSLAAVSYGRSFAASGNAVFSAFVSYSTRSRLHLQRKNDNFLTKITGPSVRFLSENRNASFSFPSQTIDPQFPVPPVNPNALLKTRTHHFRPAFQPVSLVPADIDPLAELISIMRFAKKSGQLLQCIDPTPITADN